MYEIKKEQAEEYGFWHKGRLTSDDVMDRIPEPVYAYCPAWLISKIGNEINRAYHTTSKTDAEYIHCLKCRIEELEEKLLVKTL